MGAGLITFFDSSEKEVFSKWLSYKIVKRFNIIKETFIQYVERCIFDSFRYFLLNYRSSFLLQNFLYHPHAIFFYFGFYKFFSLESYRVFIVKWIQASLLFILINYTTWYNFFRSQVWSKFCLKIPLELESEICLSEQKLIPIPKGSHLTSMEFCVRKSNVEISDYALILFLSKYRSIGQRT